MNVIYKHAKSICDFQPELIVEHRKSVFFRCPKCGWISEFIPTENHDTNDDFEFNKFTPVDETLFKVKQVKNKRKTASKTTKPKRVKKPKVKKDTRPETGSELVSFDYATLCKFKNKEL